VFGNPAQKVTLKLRKIRYNKFLHTDPDDDDGDDDPVDDDGLLRAGRGPYNRLRQEEEGHFRRTHFK
jgi:hypothetical protein